MEISLKFSGERVTKAAYWTNGCAYSLNCVCAAADLAKGKTPDGRSWKSIRNSSSAR